MQILKWAEGDARGLLHTSFMAWQHDAVKERQETLHRKEKEALEKSLREEQEEKDRKANEQIQASWNAIQSHHSQARQDLEWALAKWEKGETKGRLLETLRHGVTM